MIHNYFIYAGGIILLCGLLYMIYSVGHGDLEFKSSSKVEGFANKSSSKLKNRDRENFIATSIKQFGKVKPEKRKEKLTDITTPNNNKSSDLSKLNEKGKYAKLAGLVKPGKVDHFNDVMNEVDNIDLESISISGFTDTIKKYNTNFNNRLEYARKKNNNNDLESAMAQWDVLKDEFRKLFLFSDFI